MTLASVTGAHYRQQKALSIELATQAAALWRRLDPTDLTGSWLTIADQLFVAVSSAQLLAASTAESYTAQALAEQDTDPDPDGTLQLRAFAGIASDGRDLEPLLYSAVTTTKTLIGQGAPLALSLLSGEHALTTIVTTQIADLGRAAVATVSAADRSVTGWIRMTGSKPCSRCAVLAGRFYRYNAGFDRHEQCDCVHVPAAEARAVKDIRTSPSAYFRSLSAEDQDARFTIAGAKAIRDGANIGQVVNARRGAQGLSQPGRLSAPEQKLFRHGRETFGHLDRVDVYGRPLFVTTEGVTSRGLAGQRLGARGTGNRFQSSRTPRLMPESIYDIAGADRDEAIRLLRRFGYLI